MVEDPIEHDQPPMRARYHHGDLRAALLQAGRDLIEREAALTLRGAAQLAGVSAAAPYRHFADRDALFAGVLAQGFDELAERTGQARLAAADPVQAYLGVGAAYLQFAAEHPSLYRRMFGPDCDKPGYPDLLAAEQRAFGVVLAAATDCEAAGLLARPALEVAIAGWTMVHGLASLHTDGTLAVVHPQHELMATAQAIFGILVEGVLPRTADTDGRAPGKSKGPPKRA